MEELLFSAWNIHLNQFNSSSLHLTQALNKDKGRWISQIFQRREISYSWWSVGFWKRAIIREAAAWLYYCPSSLRLLHGSVLDYGSPLLYVITKAPNSLWQLWPGLKAPSSFVFVCLSARFVAVKSFALSPSCVFQTGLRWCGNKPALSTLHLSIPVLLYLHYFSLVHWRELSFNVSVPVTFVNEV